MTHPDDRDCLQGDPIREDPLSMAPEGLSPPTQIVRTKFKNPFLARWPPRPGDPAEEPIWAVATNFLVTFRPGLSSDEARGILQNLLGPEPVDVSRLPLPDLYLAESRIGTISKDDPPSYPLARWQDLQKHPAVLRADLDYLYFTYPLPYPLRERPAGSDQPSIEPELVTMGIPEVWKAKTTGDRCVRVAVLDTGIDIEHSQLKDNILRDKDGKIIGYNFYGDCDDVQDDSFHGTYCSGLIGAKGGKGVNLEVSLMPLKFLNSSGCGRASDAIKSIGFALAHGAQVISNSWGGAGNSVDLKKMIQRADEERALFVAGAGNGTRDLDTMPYFPAAFAVPNMISVGGSYDDDKPNLNWGHGAQRVHLSAPGVTVYSTIPPDDHAEHNGTSASTAFAAGGCALVKAAFPTMTHMEIRERILASVKPFPRSSNIASCTNGRLDLANAILGTVFPKVNCP